MSVMARLRRALEKLRPRYSGVVIKAMEAWGMAIFYFALAVVLAAMCAIGWQSIGLSIRLLKFIEDKQG